MTLKAGKLAEEREKEEKHGRDEMYVERINLDSGFPVPVLFYLACSAVCFLFILLTLFKIVVSLQ